MTGLVVAPCSHHAATHAVTRWHYSRRMPVGKLVKMGAWEEGRFIGAVLFGRGASPALGRRYGCSITEVCELVRVALTTHVAPTTQVVAAALSCLKASNPGLRLVVSFADEAEGHLGRRSIHSVVASQRRPHRRPGAHGTQAPLRHAAGPTYAPGGEQHGATVSTRSKCRRRHAGGPCWRGGFDPRRPLD